MKRQTDRIRRQVRPSVTGRGTLPMTTASKPANRAAIRWLCRAAIAWVGFAGMATDAGITKAQSGRPSEEQVKFFETKIRPVLIDKCYSCHSAEAGKASGGLLLDSRDGLLEGGDSGPALVPGKPDDSLLIEAIRFETDGLQMPPAKAGGKLDDRVIADFVQWIRMGAADPRTEAVEWVPESGAGEEARKWWAFQPIRSVTPPAMDDQDWARTAVDRFVLQAMQAGGVKPVEQADPLVLLRRVTFDLTGLPPTPERVRRFSADREAAKDDAAREVLYVALVDELLASPRFGERWGRYWLDVARYSESSGKDVNILFPQAWRYRDYVIDAFNADLPYDQFLREQIAGDLLPAHDDAERSRHLIATGYLALGPKSMGEQNEKQFQVDLADEQLDTVTQGVIGLTVACARCHDHKFDPISQVQYTALAGVFLSTDTRYGTGGSLNGRNGSTLVELPDPSAPAWQPAMTREQYQAQAERLERLEKQLREEFLERQQQRRRGTANDNGNLLRIATQAAELRTNLSNYNPDGTPRALAMAALEKPSTRSSGSATGGRAPGRLRAPSFPTLTDSPLFIRGEVDRPSSKVPRGVPDLFDCIGPRPAERNSSGRKELAEWLTDPANPLTSRVMVNRVWHWLFGAGLVTSVDNFGNSGEEPSHPELLDWLATRFMEQGWSVKKLVRELVLSRTYRLASRHDETAFAADPANRLLWRHSPRRLDAEAIRDAVLTASGKLDLQRPEASTIGRAGDGPIGGNRRSVMPEEKITGSTSYVRSVYLATARNLEPEFLATFDFPDGSMVQGARQSTNVPGQTLLLLNSEFTAKHARLFAERALAAADPDRADSDPEKRVTSTGRRRAESTGSRPAATERVDFDHFEEPLTELYLIALGRPPLKEEIQAARKLLNRYRKDPQAGWTSVARGLLASAEFRNLD